MIKCPFWELECAGHVPNALERVALTLRAEAFLADARTGGYETSLAIVLVDAGLTTRTLRNQRVQRVAGGGCELDALCLVVALTSLNRHHPD